MKIIPKGARLNANATEDEKVKAMVDGGLSHAAVSRTVGKISYCSHEFLRAHHVQEQKAQVEKSRKDREKKIKLKDIENKAKANIHIANPGVQILRERIQWKLGPDKYSQLKIPSMAKENLVSEWNKCKDVEVEDIIVPEEVADLPLPSIEDTELSSHYNKR